MTSELLYQAIGEVDDELLERYENHREHIPPQWFGWMKRSAIVASLCAVMIGGLALLSIQPSSWPIKEIANPGLPSSEIAPIPRWHEKKITQQFAYLNFNDVVYSAQYSEIDPEYIGDRLAEASMSGTDVYTDTVYETDVFVYRIKNINSDSAVAVQFDGQEGYYPYVNSYYQPETLGQFIADLDLHHTIRFGSVWYSYFEDNGEHVKIEFVGLDSTVVWEMLLFDESLKAVEDYLSHTFVSKMGISVDIPLLGYSNIRLAVTDNGYLITNILNSGKAFHIGEEQVQQFVDYVIANVQGYKIIYQEPEVQESPPEPDHGGSGTEANDGSGEIRAEPFEGTAQ